MVEMINYCMVGDFLYQSYTVKHKSYGRSLQANDFTIISERTLFIEKFVKYLCEACPEKELIFLLCLNIVAFTRQRKNGSDPTKTGTVPIVFLKKQWTFIRSVSGP